MNLEMERKELDTSFVVQNNNQKRRFMEDPIFKDLEGETDIFF